MKQGIHPTYDVAQVTCACGNAWTTRSTKKSLRTDLCSKCHPFYTGEQRIVDTAGQVDRFMRRFQRATSEPRRSRKVERSEARRTRFVTDADQETILEVGEAGPADES
jgi:large subunit ribosomal protein L31